MLRRWSPLALLALAFGLSACSTLGYPGGYPYPGDRYPDGRHGPVYDRHGDVYRTPEYRSVGRDADRYTDLLDRELGLNGGQENTIERILERRAEDLLRRTPPRDHRYVYPFPRGTRLSATARRWWDDADREINRYLDYRQRDEYRYIARDLERYGRYDRHRYERDRRYDRDRDYRYDRDRRYERDRDGDRGGPSFCRSGRGHPVFGRRWCTDRGYYPDRDRDWDDDDDDRWDDDD
ncbi:MAG: hypothetical protein R3181_09155 [Rubricoccaceae bacterium]|nr:hypothetical protein [Rubricoccaceae bacterium]